MMTPSSVEVTSGGRKWHRYRPGVQKGGRYHWPMGSRKGVVWQPVLLA